jgi:hypothetical protein
MQDPDRPELRPVVRPRRIEPATVAAAVIALAMGVAIWKPWQAPGEAGRDAARGAAARDAAALATSVPAAVARHSAGARTPRPSREPGSAASPGSAGAPGSAGTRIEVLVTSGINWSGGTSDAHSSWGVAVAYLPFGRLDDALLLRRSAIVPSVRWLAVDPRPADGSGAGGGVRADVGGQPAVALAVTWPSGVHVTSERLTYLGPLAAVSVAPAASAAPASAAPTGPARRTGPTSPAAPSPRPVSLAESVPVLLHLTAARPAGREPVSGTFFLPPSARAHAVVDWLADGWPPGTYEFEVRAGAAHYLLAFRLDSGV